MSLVDPKSLADTLNRIRWGRLRGEAFPEAGAWKGPPPGIASRISARGSCRGLPAPTPSTRNQTAPLFTGETVGAIKRAATGV